MTGRFICFEGGEGSGKSTQARLLAERLGAVLTFEPGDSPLGAAVRSILLDSTSFDISARAEALLMAADRAQHVEEVVRPALEVGRTVVCDRYIGSSIAYQGYGRQLSPAEVEGLSRWATDDLRADLIILLEVSASVSIDRRGGERDRLEAAGAAFHRRVHEGFLRQAMADPDRWAVIDGSGSVEEVARRIWEVVAIRFPDLG